MLDSKGLHSSDDKRLQSCLMELKNDLRTAMNEENFELFHEGLKKLNSLLLDPASGLEKREKIIATINQIFTDSNPLFDQLLATTSRMHEQNKKKMLCVCVLFKMIFYSCTEHLKIAQTMSYDLITPAGLAIHSRTKKNAHLALNAVIQYGECWLGEEVQKNESAFSLIFNKAYLNSAYDETLNPVLHITSAADKLSNDDPYKSEKMDAYIVLIKLFSSADYRYEEPLIIQNSISEQLIKAYLNCREEKMQKIEEPAPLSL